VDIASDLDLIGGAQLLRVINSRAIAWRGDGHVAAKVSVLVRRRDPELKSPVAARVAHR
jgi:hypothetical protein